ncbi:flagellar biosynthesis anti-sigma factor FlgM [Pradoshia sp. D12]|uniref:flagellar biosynthesis anti-sigma factor FlgM n=1 Tax=Bacillaceae TaxID=186817 RepID=UPI00080ACA35|nr:MULTISPECIES: flagellar biosynthesis anti-sigma factor FlgM [Bacillaceae]OCA84669.1 flagellar biosynthesis anti-sigma factor FlgM [Bacillus sp. FJAT-27986]QFK72872.1 flagellar biosynthesis anti-sigma factor FlgM [Pradoshia sp. D12]TPF71865.1 flagellar biosynthesis anti-sigma factor FlgM [Bacillus sp. D12]
MKINHLNQYGVNPYQKAVNKADTSMKPSQLADKVEISSKAKELQQLSSVEVERQAKIDEIKKQIENGTYQVNVNETAKGVLDFYSKN